MAFTMKLPVLAVLVLVFTTKIIHHAECSMRKGGLDSNRAASETRSRKFLQQVLDGLKSRKSDPKGTNSERYEDLVAWDLRKVPSGPDPLHHNGGSPKKPRTP